VDHKVYEFIAIIKDKFHFITKRPKRILPIFSHSKGGIKLILYLKKSVHNDVLSKLGY